MEPKKKKQRLLCTGGGELGLSLDRYTPREIIRDLERELEQDRKKALEVLSPHLLDELCKVVLGYLEPKPGHRGVLMRHRNRETTMAGVQFRVKQLLSGFTSFVSLPCTNPHTHLMMKTNHTTGEVNYHSDMDPNFQRNLKITKEFTRFFGMWAYKNANGHWISVETQCLPFVKLV